MDIGNIIKEIDAFLKSKGLKSKKEIQNQIIIKGFKDNQLVVVFSIKKDSAIVKIDLIDQSIYLDVREFAEKIHASIWIDGRQIDTFISPFTVPDTSEKVVPKVSSIKSEMDPNNIPSDERFLEIVSQIKNKMQAEIPLMSQEIIEQLGDNLSSEMIEKLKQAVYATATTTSMLTIRFLMETINDVIGE